MLTDKQAEAILTYLQDGQPFGEACARAGASPKQMYLWRDSRPANREALVRARSLHALTLIDKLQGLTEQLVNQEIDPRYVRAIEVALSNWRWVAGKLDPDVWGDAPATAGVTINLGELHLAALMAGPRAPNPIEGTAYPLLAQGPPVNEPKAVGGDSPAPQENSEAPLRRKRGRPKGSKNIPKVAKGASDSQLVGDAGHQSGGLGGESTLKRRENTLTDENGV